MKFSNKNVDSDNLSSEKKSVTGQNYADESSSAGYYRRRRGILWFFPFNVITLALIVYLVFASFAASSLFKTYEVNGYIKKGSSVRKAVFELAGFGWFGWLKLRMLDFVIAHMSSKAKRFFLETMLSISEDDYDFPDSLYKRLNSPRFYMWQNGVGIIPKVVYPKVVKGKFTLLELFDEISQKPHVYFQVRLTPGQTVAEFWKRLEENLMQVGEKSGFLAQYMRDEKVGLKKAVEDYLRIMKNNLKSLWEEYIAEFEKRGYKKPKIELKTLEGLILAEDYKFDSELYPEENAYYFFEVFVKELKERKNQLKNFAQKHGLDLYQILTLASIVEKEATAGDKRLVASVFLNRLGYGMKLESCATLNYILKKKKVHLTYKDLKADSEYNTYRHEGLPPTPICCFSLDTLDAVLNAPKTKYYYFFTPDGKRHLFSRTYKEHRRKIKKYGVYGRVYQRQRKGNEGDW